MDETTIDPASTPPPSEPIPPTTETSVSTDADPKTEGNTPPLATEVPNAGPAQYQQPDPLVTGDAQWDHMRGTDVVKIAPDAQNDPLGRTLPPGSFPQPGAPSYDENASEAVLLDHSYDVGTVSDAASARAFMSGRARRLEHSADLARARRESPGMVPVGHRGIPSDDRTRTLAPRAYLAAKPDPRVAGTPQPQTSTRIELPQRPVYSPSLESMHEDHFENVADARENHGAPS
jgi:hypothetical protein